jgi:hypothetical protein
LAIAERCGGLYLRHSLADEENVGGLPSSTYDRPRRREGVIEMAIHYGARQEDVIAALIRGKGLKRFQPFFVTGEGRELPSGIEEVSGLVLDVSGVVYSFWIKWDDETRQEKFSEWEPIELEPRLFNHPEYRRARAMLGLPPL